VEKGLQATVVANATADYSGDITIPASVMYEGNTYQVNAIGNNAFNDCSGLTSIISESRTPPTLGMNALGSSKQKSNITLYIPLQTTKTYQDAGWTGFKEYIEMTEGISRSLTISSAGQGTYCTDIDLDFSGIEDVKAYIASGFIQKTGTVILTRVTDVPAGTGLFVKGAAGTYEIPYKASSAYYKNMLKGNIDPMSVDPTTGDYANYYLSDGSDGLGFYRISSTRTMSANRAILQIPTWLNATQNESRAINIVFDDEMTGISDATVAETQQADCYDLMGRRVAQPKRGLYIKNGKKMIIK
jgi:hypothetical protein